MKHRLLFWLAYRLKHALLEDALNANAELRREVKALRWRLRQLDPTGERIAAVHLLGTRPYARPDRRPWGKS